MFCAAGSTKKKKKIDLLKSLRIFYELFIFVNDNFRYYLFIENASCSTSPEELLISIIKYFFFGIFYHHKHFK